MQYYLHPRTRWNKNFGTLALFVFCLFVFVALRPMSTAMVIAGRSVHLTTLFSWASLNKQLTSNRAHTFACNWKQPFMNDSAEGRRMTVEIISWSISTKVWDRAGIELATPGSAVSFASVTRHVTDCATRPGGDTCTLPGTMIQSVLVVYDKWGLMPPYPLNSGSGYNIQPYQTFQEIISSNQTLKRVSLKSVKERQEVTRASRDF